MYYTTEAIARAAGISPAAARYYLQKSGFKPEITNHRIPRHCRVYSWPASALPWLRTRLANRPICPAPNPLAWIPAAEASKILSISPAHLRRLITSGKLRSRRCLIKTKHGAQWRSYIRAADASTYTRRPRMYRTPESAHLTLPILLLRTWLILRGIEDATATRALALYISESPGNLLISTESGQRYAIDLTAPETSPGLPSNLIPPDCSAEDWQTAITAFRTAQQHTEKGQVLTISAGCIDLWSDFTTHRAHLAQYPLPITATYG